MKMEGMVVLSGPAPVVIIKIGQGAYPPCVVLKMVRHLAGNY